MHKNKIESLPDQSHEFDYIYLQSTMIWLALGLMFIIAGLFIASDTALNFGLLCGLVGIIRSCFSRH